MSAFWIVEHLNIFKDTELLQPVDQVIQSFRAFEKKLKSQPWFHAQVIFSYYHLIRDSYRNCYVVRYYLTFQKVFYSSDIDYSALLLQLWQDATYGLGILLEIPDEEFQKTHGNPFGLGQDEIVHFPEPQNPLDDLGDLPDTMSCVNEKMNKICIVTRGFEIFNGQKRWLKPNLKQSTSVSNQMDTEGFKDYIFFTVLEMICAERTPF